MEGVLIKSIVTGGENSDDFFKEKIILLFDRIKCEYFAPQIAGEEEVTSEYIFDWDIANNKKN